jgi:hypothetical protein
MKWRSGVLFLISLYLFTITHYFLDNIILEVIFGLLLFVSSIANVVISLKCAFTTQEIEKVRNEMRRIMLFIKLLSVPCFVVNFLIWALYGIVPMGFVMWIFLPLVIFITYSVLLVTSSFSVSTIILYGKSKKLSKVEIIVHIWLQLIFVIDVIDAIYLFIVLNKRETSNGLNNPINNPI